MTVLFQALYHYRGQPYRIDVIEHYTGGICWSLYRIKKPNRYHPSIELMDILMAERVPAMSRHECSRFPKHAGLHANALLDYYLACQESGVPDDGQSRLL